MLREYQHLVRAGALLTLLVVGILGVRQVMVPESFGDYGHYRGDNVKEWASRPLAFADPADCTTCHAATHGAWFDSKHRTNACENCHGPGEGHVLDGRPVATDRSNDLCLTCHERLQARPAGFPQVNGAEHSLGLQCIVCHNPMAPTIGARPAPPHPLNDSTPRCSLCHGQEGVKAIPADHEGRTIEVCARCHGSADAVPAEVSSKPPDIPHSIVDRNDCIFCHALGFTGATRIPHPHAEPGIAFCERCHQRAAEVVPAPARSSGPPLIPHDVGPQDQCTICHVTGRNGAPVFPTSHVGRSAETCRACHMLASAAPEPKPVGQPAEGTATPPPAPPSIPHALEGRGDCVSCHGTGLAGAPATPADHAGRNRETCTLCHAPAPTATPVAPAGAATPTPAPAEPTPAATTAPAGPPAIPHTLDGRAQCLLCHEAGVLGAPVAPADHAGRNRETCTLCHAPAPTATPVAPAGAATPAPAPAEPTPTPTPNAVPAGPPAIPHTLDGRAQCLLCHEAGVLGAPAAPADHAGRTSEICTLCHKGTGQ